MLDPQDYTREQLSGFEKTEPWSRQTGTATSQRDGGQGKDKAEPCSAGMVGKGLGQGHAE